jgi:hypothetical protein
LIIVSYPQESLVKLSELSGDLTICRKILMSRCWIVGYSLGLISASNPNPDAYEYYKTCWGNKYRWGLKLKQDISFFWEAWIANAR